MAADIHEMLLPFLGKRTYLQGTTLFEALLALRPEATDISFKIAKPLLTDRVEIRISDQPSEVPGAASLTFQGLDQHQHIVEVRPLAPSPRIGREPFAEQDLIALAGFDGDTIRLDRPSPFTTIKTIVSLNKALLTRLWQPPMPGQWLFGRLDVTHYPQDFKDMALTYRMRASFAALTSDISVDGAPLGRVVFSWRTI